MRREHTPQDIPLFALTTVTGLATLGVYLIPDYPEIAPYVQWGVLALGVATLLYFWRGLPHPPIDLKRPLYFVIGTAIVLIGSAWWQLNAGLPNSRDWDTIMLPLRLLVFAFIAILTFTILWPNKPTVPSDAAGDRSKGMRALLGALAIAVGGYLIVQGIYTFTDFRAESSSYGPATPWAEQINVAQQKASEHTPDAVLVGLSARPVYSPKYTLHTALEESFVFSATNRNVFQVEMKDIRPKATVRLTPDSLWVRHYSRASDLELYRQALSEVKISPREALQKTVSDITEVLRREEERAPISLAVDLHSIDLYLVGEGIKAGELMKEAGLEAVYKVVYFDPTFTVLTYWLHPGTGEILKREEHVPFRNSGTPTPLITPLTP